MSLSRKQIDFLYWHAVSKMRMGDFADAAVLFRLVGAVAPERTDAALGRAYCLVRQGEVAAAAEIVAELRRRMLRPEEMALLGRLHRRCEFERARSQRGRQAARGERRAVTLPPSMLEPVPASNSRSA